LTHTVVTLPARRCY